MVQKTDSSNGIKPAYS